MGSQIIVGPDGVENEFPDSWDDAKIDAAMRKMYAKPGAGDLPEWARQPADKGYAGPNPGGEFVPSMDDPEGRVGAALLKFANGASFGLFPKAAAKIREMTGGSDYATELENSRRRMSAADDALGGAAVVPETVGMALSAARLPLLLGRAGAGGAGAGYNAAVKAAAGGPAAPAVNVAGNVLKQAVGTALDMTGYNAALRGVDKATDPGATADQAWNAAGEAASPEEMAKNLAIGAAVPTVTTGLPRALRAVSSKLNDVASQFAYRALRPTPASAEPMIDRFGTTQNAGEYLRTMRLPDGTPVITEGDTATSIYNKLKAFTGHANDVLDAARAQGAEAPFNVKEVIANLNSIMDNYFNNAGGRTAGATAAGAARKEVEKMISELTARAREVPSYDLVPQAVRVVERAGVGNPEPVVPQSKIDELPGTEKMTPYVPDESVPFASPVQAQHGAPPRLVAEDVVTRPAVTEKRPVIRKKGKFASGGERVVVPGGPGQNTEVMTGEPTRESTTRPAPQPAETDLGWRGRDVEVPVQAAVADLPTTQDVTSLKKAYGQYVHGEGARRYPMSSRAIANDPELSALNEATGVLTKAEEEALRNALSSEDFAAFMKAKGQYGAGEGLADVAYGGRITEQTPLRVGSVRQAAAHAVSKLPVLPRTLRAAVESTAGYGQNAADVVYGLGKWADRLNVSDVAVSPELAQVLMALREGKERSK